MIVKNKFRLKIRRKIKKYKKDKKICKKLLTSKKVCVIITKR